MSLKKYPTLSLSIVSSIGLLLSACGSSSSHDTASTEVSGTVFASYVEGASVTASDNNGNMIAGPTLSDEMGVFTLSIPNQYLGSQLIFNATGGQYRDEATGDSTNNSMLSAIIEEDSLVNAQTPQLSLTPSSTIIQRLISEHNFNLEDAMLQFEEAFGYIPDTSVLPLDVTQASDDVDEERSLSGLRAATFSQLTSDLGLPPEAQGALLTLLADDIADGTFDGMEDGINLMVEFADSNTVDLGESIQNRFNEAFHNFRNSDNDLSGLDNASTGQRPFAKTASSDNYVVTYIPKVMHAQQGKTEFSLLIEDHQGNPVSDLNPTLAPLMLMADRNHATPFTSVSEDSEEVGLYHATVYYLMPSIMASGDSMGNWQLSVSIADDEITFYPTVMMSMGDTSRVNLKSQSEFVSGMMGIEEKRTYILFNNGLSEGDEGYDFSVYLATKESMMSFPALELGETYNAETTYELVVNNITVEMSSTPDDDESWILAENNSTGVWIASGITDINDSVFVRVSVNNEQATDDGGSPDGLGDEAEFVFGSESMDSMEHMHDSNDMEDMHGMM